MAPRNKSNTLEIERIYDAPVEAVWDAWTDVKQVAQWWGPRGFTLTTKSKELKVGGQWIYTMHGPDGVDYPNITTYHEIIPYSKLVYDHGATPTSPPMFRVEVTFSKYKGKTKMQMKMIFDSIETAEESKKFIKKAGGHGTWDRLAEYLEKETTGKEKFYINRTFDAPISVLYEMWTNPDHFSKWLPPTGFKMEFIEKEIRPGGSTLYFMTNGNDVKMYGRANYLELSKESQITYKQQFCDEKGNISRHPLAPIWPETMLTIVEFTAENENQTRVTVSWEPIDGVTKNEIEAFIQERSGMTQGWTGSFDKLEEYLGSFIKSN